MLKKVINFCNSWEQSQRSSSALNEGFTLLNSEIQLVQRVVYRAPNSARTTHRTGATTACTQYVANMYSAPTEVSYPALLC